MTAIYPNMLPPSPGSARLSYGNETPMDTTMGSSEGSLRRRSRKVLCLSELHPSPQRRTFAVISFNP